jgi:hypothetical protein
MGSLGCNCIVTLHQFGNRRIFIQVHAEIQSRPTCSPIQLCGIDDGGVKSFDTTQEKRRFRFVELILIDDLKIISYSLASSMNVEVVNDTVRWRVDFSNVLVSFNPQAFNGFFDFLQF